MRKMLGWLCEDMDTAVKHSERREYERFEAKERVLVLIGSDADGMLYHVIDMSKGGLSFRYFGEEEDSLQVSEISIVVGNTFSLERVPVEIVSDTSLQQGNIALRRKGLRFGDLLPFQETLIDDFLSRYTIGRG